MSTLPLVFSVTSGKGGVGKTNVAVNLACTLAAAGKRVLLMDGDLGLASVDVLLGMTPERNIFHLFFDGVTMRDILYDTPYGFKILPASSGVSEMLSLDTGQKLDLLEAMDVLENDLDYLIVDTGAGINDSVLYFNLAVQERLVVLTPEPTALTDAYALIKVMQMKHEVGRFRVLVNLADDERAAKDVFTRLYMACDHFLTGIVLDFAGFVPKDICVRKGVSRQVPFSVAEPQCPASLALRKLAENVQSWEPAESLDGNIKFFWKKLLFRS